MDDFTKALVAAVIGGFMVMAGQYVQDRRRDAAEKKKKKAEKLEELSALLYDASFYIRIFEGRLRSGETWDDALQNRYHTPLARLLLSQMSTSLSFKS